MENAAERISFAATSDIVEIQIDGRISYSGGVEELKTMLEQHEKFIDYIDSHEEDE